jgi:hypothetical protein
VRLESPDTDLVILMVAVQTLVGCAYPFRQESNVVPEGFDTYLDLGQATFNHFKPFVDPAELSGKEIDELGVLVGRHSCLGSRVEGQ